MLAGPRPAAGVWNEAARRQSGPAELPHRRLHSASLKPVSVNNTLLTVTLPHARHTVGNF